MQAYAYYEAKEFDESISAAKRYVTLHPGSGDAAYAQFLIASSYFEEIPDITRDQGRTEKAMQALEEVARKYPTTEYATSAKKKLEVARDQLAGKEMLIGRWYLDRKDYTGAINRFKTVVTQYQTTRHVEEALMRLTESYMALGIVPEAQTAAAVLGHNFPDSPWYKDAYNLVRGGGAEPSENKDFLARAACSPRRRRPKARPGKVGTGFPSGRASNQNARLTALNHISRAATFRFRFVLVCSSRLTKRETGSGSACWRAFQSGTSS